MKEMFNYLLKEKEPLEWTQLPPGRSRTGPFCCLHARRRRPPYKCDPILCVVDPFPTPAFTPPPPVTSGYPFLSSHLCDCCKCSRRGGRLLPLASLLVLSHLYLCACAPRVRFEAKTLISERSLKSPQRVWAEKTCRASEESGLSSSPGERADAVGHQLGPLLFLNVPDD